MRALLKKSSITKESTTTDLIQEAQELMKNSSRSNTRQVVKAERVSKDDPNIKIILRRR